MTLLTRHLLRQNLFLLLLVCGVGLGVYVFIDLFDRLDEFLEAGVGFSSISMFFIFSLPHVLAQIFPAVFLVATLIQLGLMLRSRELLALEACAVSPGAVSRSLVAHALVLGLFQLLFSEVLGTIGHQAAERIWSEEVRHRQIENRTLSDIWFREGAHIVHMATVSPARRAGTGLTMHVLDPDGAGIAQTIRAEGFEAAPRAWVLLGVTRTIPATFAEEKLDRLEMDVLTDVRGFLTVDPKASLESLPLWRLGNEIRRLKDTGSNIERLRTAWHMKLAYAGSMVVMVLIALAVVSIWGSLFVIVPVGLLATFGYYGLFVLCASAGEKGLIPPMLAAWGGNMVFMGLAGGRMLLGRFLQLG